jgi:hypothetical protein
MKATILFHPVSETARTVEEYAHDFERTRGTSIELLSLETRDGADLAKLYGITRYPAIIARRDDGEMLQLWEGDPLPLMDEVAAHLR